MRVDDLIDAIGKIDPEYVKEAELDGGETEDRKLSSGKKNRAAYRGKSSYRVALSLAACMVLLLFAGTAARWHFHAGYESDSAEFAMEAEDKNETAMMEEAVAEEGAAAETIVEEAAEKEDTAEETADLAADSSVTGMVFVVNETNQSEGVLKESVTSDRNVTALKKSREELEDYYGVSFTDEMFPDDLSCQKDCEDAFVLYYDDTDNVVSDENTLNYVNEEKERSVSITLSRLAQWEKLSDYETSVIQGQEMIICHYTEENREYYAVFFERSGVHFKIKTENITETELKELLNQFLTENQT